MTPTNNTTQNALATMLAGIRPEDLLAAISLIKGDAPTATQADSTAKPKRTRTAKTAPATSAAPSPIATPAVLTPAVHVAPVVATAPNGMKVDITDPYRRMVEFTHQAIRVLAKADGNKSKGIHSVFSGFNSAFGQHFNMAKEQVWATVNIMTERGDIASRFCAKGKMLYLPGDNPQGQRVSTDTVLSMILGGK